MGHLHLEFTIEPFAEGRPGPHVLSAVDAVAAAGLEVELGPFASTAYGPADTVRAASAALIDAAFAAGARRVSLSVSADRPAGAAPPLDLNGALGRMLAELEHELATPLAELERSAKQAAVRTLDQRGAFTLRRSIEDVADALGVSRVTIYNYLDLIRAEGGAPPDAAAGPAVEAAR